MPATTRGAPEEAHMTYKDAGVNLKLGDDASKILYEASKLTFKNREGRIGGVVEMFSDFTGLRGIPVGNLPADAFTNMNLDGVGTKIEAAERTGRHDTVAFDLFAMVTEDAAIRGVEPTNVGSILDVNTLGKDEGSHIELVRQLAAGYVRAAEAAGVAVVNGEIAELGARVHGYGAFNYNWGASVLWFGRKSRMLTGKDVVAGDSIVAFREKGFRSNGLSLLRRTLQKKHGDEWHAEKLGGSTLGELALEPSRIYTKAIVEMTGGFEGEPKAAVHAMAHVTGGGIPGKLGRALKPSGLGAVIHNPFDPCDLMRYCQEAGNVSGEEAYKAWNMGQGMLVITPEPEAVRKVAARHDIESQEVGIVQAMPAITIKNGGVDSDKHEWLRYSLE